ncbi:MAG: hypothetical protein ACI9SQ_000387 [Rubritalea sp.]|jgi:hypothetical protein
MLTYPPETVIAEKLEAAVELQLGNSRIKDFFDLDWLHSHRSFEYSTLRQAVLNTFERRQSPIPEDIPIFLQQTFANNPSKVTQWNAFLKKNKLLKKDLSELLNQLTPFIMPLISPENPTPKHWTPTKGWH